MADITIAQNDKGFYISFTINDSTGVAYNLAGYTVKLKVWLANQYTTPIVTGDCEVVSAALGTCRYLVVATDFANINNYYGEIELTKSGVVESTEKFAIEVKESA